MRCRRRRYRPRRRNRATTGRARAHLLCPMRRSLVPILVLFVVFFLVVLVTVFVVVEIVVFLVVFRREIELDRREAGHLEIGAAFGATELIALVDVELVDLDIGVAFGAGGHRVLDRSGAPFPRTARLVPRTVWQSGR